MPRKLHDIGERFTLRLDSTLLSDDVVSDTPKWVQVASEGVYKGYAGGSQQFTLDEAKFNQVVANCRRHPSFIMGNTGEGISDVVAWDFHHASEMPANDGTIPSTGAPAQAWVRDLQVRRDSSGKVQLWALTRWLEPAKTYVKEERYKWASVSIVFDAIDPKTGENIGALLTSIALTNQPFIEGMQPLVADKRADLRRRHMYVEAANSPERAIEMIRSMLGLPETADAVAVASEIEKINQWASGGGTPLGVDLDEIIGALRTILNLPSLSDTSEVMTEAGKLISSIAQAQPTVPVTPPPVSPPATTEPPPVQAPAPMSRKNDMEFLKMLAEKLGVIPKEDAVTDAVAQLVQLRATSAQIVNLGSTASTQVLCKALLDDAGVREKYGPLLRALGVEDPDAALDRVGTLMTESEELKKVAPELASLRAKAEAMAEEEEEEDVEEAMASMQIAGDSPNYTGIRLAVEHYRKTHTQEEFLARYPKPEAGVRHLTQDVSGTKSGKQAKTVTASARNQTGSDALDVSAYTGANLMLKTCEFVRCSVTGAQSWPWSKVHEHAAALVRSKKVTAS